MEKLVAGINGFGRFGLHLLKYWLERAENCPFIIKYINDRHLSISDVRELLLHDNYVHFADYEIRTNPSEIVFVGPKGHKFRVRYSRGKVTSIPWLGKPHLLFECSGNRTSLNACQIFLSGKTSQVIISATSWDSDQTLIFGFNHQDWSPRSQVISYGSCTVNAFVPLANWVNGIYRIADSDVHVIHNTPKHKFQNLLVREPCTLEASAPRLLQFLDPQCFEVAYTKVPYSGVSMIDYRFRVEHPVSREAILTALKQAIVGGPLAGLYQVIPEDSGPQVHNCTTYSAVIVENNSQVRSDNIHLQGYFDTENSANRFFDLADYISSKMLETIACASSRGRVGCQDDQSSL